MLTWRIPRTKQAKRRGSPLSYRTQNTKWRKLRKRVGAYIDTINQKGHEHITLMIVPHAANTPVFTVRISKYIIIFISLLLAVTMVFSISAIVDKRYSDPQIAMLDRQVQLQEDVLDQFVRNAEKLDSGMKDFVYNLRSIVQTTSGLPLSRMRLFSGSSPYPNGKSELANNIGNYAREIRLLDSINFNILRAAQQLGRIQNLLLSMRPYVRFQFFRHRERTPVGDGPAFWPVDNGGTITSPFGDRFNFDAGFSTRHNGVDIGNTHGSIIRATAPGEVLRVDYEPHGYGLYIEVKHDNGFISRYAHLDKQEVFKGDLVYQGQIVGRMGRTGLATGDHVHYEVMKDGDFLDPTGFMENKFKPANLPQP